MALCRRLDSVSMVLQAAAFLFYAIALGLPKWSTGSVSTQGVTGSMDIGLWKVCVSTNPPEDVFHSTGSDCRIGHCPVQSTFSVGSNWNSNDLCGRSKASASFVIFALMLSFCFLWYSIGYVLRGYKPSIVWATLTGALAAICGIVAWAVWLGWQNLMNNDDGRNFGTVLFSNLDSGPAFGLTVAASVFNIVATLQYSCGARCSPHTLPPRQESETDLDLDDSMELADGPRWGTEA